MRALILVPSLSALSGASSYFSMARGENWSMSRNGVWMSLHLMDISLGQVGARGVIRTQFPWSYHD